MQTDWRVWQNRQVAETFVTERRRELLGAEAQIETMLHLLRQCLSSAGTVLDLGCGDGILLAAVQSAFPDISGVAQDGSSAMLAKAKERFGGSARVTFVEADFNELDWRDTLPTCEYTAIISGFAIHHSEDERKQELYRELFGLLKPGSVFINIEHVASASPFGERLADEAMVGHACRTRAARGESVDFEEMLRAHDARADKAANRLTSVETQLQWLRDIGFANVDCYWKHYELAVLAGFKPQ